jgi:hypothetical protein
MCATKYQNAKLKKTDILLTRWKLSEEKNHFGQPNPGYPLFRR